ncbi:MAG: hypothetical protein SWH61_09610 [Thermodesulfobacteriota bacterium]|nr:hypothetical protein [Thermodesulfobacteriota bacterium]
MNGEWREIRAVIEIATGSKAAACGLKEIDPEKVHFWQRGAPDIHFRV